MPFEQSQFRLGLMPGLDIGAEILKAAERAKRELGHINILIAGRSGVGKSTLINSVFEGNLAATGQGRPVTQHTREITKEGMPLTIWDTRGLEIAAYKETLSLLERHVMERRRESDPCKHIHIAWLCLNEDSARVETAEIELHEMLAKHMPVMAVITKARSDGGFRAKVQELLPLTKSVLRVRAVEERFDDGHALAPFGLAELIEASVEVAPEGMRNAFVAAQKVSIDAKRKAALKIVGASAATALGIGATPIPFADAFLLVPVQAGMLAGISAVFGLNVTTSFLSTLLASAAGGSVATVAGRALVINALKLVPGANVAASAISAATASALTTALGGAYIAALTIAFNRSDDRTPTQVEIEAAFRSELGK
jgi:predicted GTPase/uncharacterized protein (DUF697 family)